MANVKVVGPDHTSEGALKAGEIPLQRQIAILYTRCMRENKVSKSWKSSNMVLINETGDSRDLNNYRPISLPSKVYKIFTTTLIENQPMKRAGFCTEYSTIDRVHIVNKKGKMYRISTAIVLSFR